MTEKMKSVWALGSRPHFSRPPAEAEPVRRPEPRPTSDCTTWYPEPLAWAKGFEERQQPGPAVGLGQTRR